MSVRCRAASDLGGSGVGAAAAGGVAGDDPGAGARYVLLSIVVSILLVLLSIAVLFVVLVVLFTIDRGASSRLNSAVAPAPTTATITPLATPQSHFLLTRLPSDFAEGTTAL
jgi:hypothetical protein